MMRWFVIKDDDLFEERKQIGKKIDKILEKIKLIQSMMMRR